MRRRRELTHLRCHAVVSKGYREHSNGVAHALLIDKLGIEVENDPVALMVRGVGLGLISVDVVGLIRRQSEAHVALPDACRVAARYVFAILSHRHAGAALCHQLVVQPVAHLLVDVIEQTCVAGIIDH